MTEGTDIIFELNAALCKACGICMGLCAKQALEKDFSGKPVLAKPEQCTVCSLCELRCPDFAIRIRRIGA